MQKLTSMLAALNRFLVRSSDKCRPMFGALKKRAERIWDEKCDEVLTRIKQYLNPSPPPGSFYSEPWGGTGVVLGSISGCSQRSFNEGVRATTFANLLRQQDHGRRKNQVLAFRKACSGVSMHSSETWALFLGSHGKGSHQASVVSCLAKGRPIWKVGEMGDRA